MKKVLLGVLLLGVGGLSAVVAMQPDSFDVEYNDLIAAPQEKIFPYLNNFKKGGLWSPYEQRDLHMIKTYLGPEAGVGAIMEFEGNSDVGAGRLEITNQVPNQLVEIQLHMTKPFTSDSTITYRLSREAALTRFSWSMHAKKNFIAKVMGLIFDCRKMVMDDLKKGTSNLKNIVETQ